MAKYFGQGIVGLKFKPKDEDVIKHLRWKVEGGRGSFIEESDVYGVEPWLLPHVTDPVFEEKECYYFVRKTSNNAVGKKQNRTVKGKEGGGTWRSTNREASIHSRSDPTELIGHSQNFTFMKNETGTKTKTKTHWLMKEYRLPSTQSQQWVLCRIKLHDNDQGNKNKNEFPQLGHHRVNHGDVLLSAEAVGISPSMMDLNVEEDGALQQQIENVPGISQNADEEGAPQELPGPDAFASDDFDWNEGLDFNYFSNLIGSETPPSSSQLLTL